MKKLLSVVENRYGNELGSFEMDYLGEYPGFDIVILNAVIKILEQGILIYSRLGGDKLFMEWGSITAINFTRDKNTLVKVINVDGIVRLQKVKKETDLDKMKKILGEQLPNIKINFIPANKTLISSLELRRAEKRYDEQDRRIKALIGKYEDDEDRILEEWESHLRKELAFPFEVEIVDESGPLEIGDIVKVTGIEHIEDLYGILVAVKFGRRKYIWALCDLEVVEKSSNNFQLVDDYATWFCNR